MPADIEALDYIRELIKAHEEHLRAVFCYGTPDGDDIDVCVVCDKPEAVAPAKPPIDQKVLTDKQFRQALREHEKEAKEFRIYYGNSYVLRILEDLGMRDVQLYDLIP